MRGNWRVEEPDGGAGPGVRRVRRGGECVVAADGLPGEWGSAPGRRHRSGRALQAVPGLAEGAADGEPVRVRPPDGGHREGVERDDFAAGYAERNEVLEALRGLAPRQRACVVLRYYEDLSVEQTAEVLGCSEGTVKSQAARGLDTLRKAIDRARRTSRAL